MSHTVAVVINESLLRPYVTEGSEFHVRCIEGLPKGAQMVGSYFDPRTFQAVLIYEHESLPWVEEGQVIPRIAPVLMDLEPEG